MPNDQKPLKERIAALKAKRNEISREAKVRVASAYTVAKTLAPKAPAEIQSVIASALLTIPDTKVLVAAVKQSAVNNYYTKIAEELRDIHKVEMNDLLEKPEVLSKMKSEVESELKGGPKSAAAKTADDRTECGKQPESYTDPSIGITPKEMDASNAADRKPETVDKTMNDKEVAVDKKSASAKKAGCTCGKDGCAECKTAKEAAKTAHEGCTGPNDCATCKAAAAAQAKVGTAKKADDMPMDAPAGDAAPMGDAPAGDEAPAGDAAMDAPAGDDMPAGDTETQGEIVIDSEKKEEIKEQIDSALSSIEAVKSEIDETAKEDGEELLDLAEGLNPEEDDIEVPGDETDLDIDNIFADENLNEHKGALANEGEGAGEEITFDNEPTSAEAMEAALEGGDEVGSAADFFASEEGEENGLDVLLASAHSAGSVAGVDVVPSNTGEAASHFEADELGGKEVDNESDHDEDIFGDVLKSLKCEDYNEGKYTRTGPGEQEPDQKEPEPVKGGKQSGTNGDGSKQRVATKQAAKPVAKTAGKPIRRLKVSEPVTQKQASELSSLLFRDEADYL